MTPYEAVLVLNAIGFTAAFVIALMLIFLLISKLSIYVDRKFPRFTTSAKNFIFASFSFAVLFGIGMIILRALSLI